jgi:DNA adenine methylase
MQPLLLRPATELTPPLKWAGGKRWLVPKLLPLWQPHAHRRLIEPFVGGMAVTLGLMPSKALLNDANPHLINFYSWLTAGLIIDIEMANDAELYYQHRARFNTLMHQGDALSKESAELFYYLNRTCYNGLCRFNNKGEFNVPFGKYKNITYTRDFTKFRDALSEWELRTGDFSGINVTSDDLIYADPPYDVEFTTYSPGGFSWSDQIRLANWLAEHAGPIIASNQATPRILQLYESLGFEITIVDAPRMISCNGDRSPAKEMLAIRGF